MKKDIFEIEEIQIENGSVIASGDEDPRTFLTNYPLGSFYMRTNGEMWKKSGPSVEDWTILSGDMNYVHQQSTPDSTWVINHSLGKYPTVKCYDSSGDEIEGEIKYTSSNSLTILYSASCSGIAYLN
jgi:hypothetical protein